MTGDGHLDIADWHPACRVLGPGTRYVLWVQGCPLSCAGCVSPQWIPFGGGRRVAVDDLAATIAATAADGLTLSGGEPFAQAGALARLVSRIRAVRDLSVMCFTGYSLDHLASRGGPAAVALLSLVDILVDGPYLARRHADLRWRGSANQRVHQLTDRHAGDLVGPDVGAGLQIEVAVDGTVQWLGVPPVPGFRAEFERAIGVIPQQPQGEESTR
ncbi:4Fe-4S single cluster domain-containing protein [Actinocrispum wychmicini]|uniref:Anaerobic ribonucleoside-triphosphate reductase activating protein n=1 Tax=Actinocrispum wychmicini TaxID=1213861 RepID=A0A4R2IRJ7_9PSEU|nr:4Fe-4S single cluster domain-containing protein [Actinocrispum wychmicini]TCO48021.1 anaerobic ribonucleoside-triphosphate reductase activating protein [Actinocrispum wychmicini]